MLQSWKDGGGGESPMVRRRERGRVMQEGEALWRAKQRQQWISKIQDQREARDMLRSYAPWGKPGCGAPTSDIRKKKLQELISLPDQRLGQGTPAMQIGRGGCGAPLRTRSGRLQTKMRSEPLLRFHEPARHCVDNEIRYRVSPLQQLAYRSQLDSMVLERRKAQAEARKTSSQDLRHMLMAPPPWGRPGPGGVAWRPQRSTELRFLHSLGWSSDPTLRALVSKPADERPPEDVATPSGEADRDRPPILTDDEDKPRDIQLNPELGNGLVPLLARRRAATESSLSGLGRHPLCSTDVTRHEAAGIMGAARWQHDDNTGNYLQELRRQVASKQKLLEEMRTAELETSRQHFETWRHFWGRPGHGAPKLPMHRETLADLLNETTPVPRL